MRVEELQITERWVDRALRYLDLCLMLGMVDILVPPFVEVLSVDVATGYRVSISGGETTDPYQKEVRIDFAGYISDGCGRTYCLEKTLPQVQPNGFSLVSAR